MRKRAKRDQGVTLRALDVLNEGGNTSEDVADELNIPLKKASECITRLKNAGKVTRTDRRIARGGHRIYRVFEVVA